MREQQYQIGQEVVPGYTLVRPLGSGMAGDVWIARGAGGTRVAIKIVRSLSAIGGRKELKALKTIRNVRHPNLCPVHGFWTKDADGRLLEDGESDAIFPDNGTERESVPGHASGRDTLNIAHVKSERPIGGSERSPAEQLIVVMGLGDRTLHDRLDEVRRNAGLTPNDRAVTFGLKAEETIHFLRPAADAIDELNQEHNIYHCDIKPQNILIVGRGAQVCDFGLANRIEGDSRMTSHPFASPAYAAPEVLDGMTYSRGVDQYSLAVTYYELRTGQLPFDVSSVAKIMQAKCSGNLDLTGVPSAERRVLQKALNVDPAQRYATCTQFINELAVASGVDRRPAVTPIQIISIGLATFAIAAIAGIAYERFSRPPEKREVAESLDVVEPLDVAESLDVVESPDVVEKADAKTTESAAMSQPSIEDVVRVEHEPERSEIDVEAAIVPDPNLSDRVLHDQDVPAEKITHVDVTPPEPPQLVDEDEARFIWLFARYGVRGATTAEIAERQLTQSLELDPHLGPAFRDRAIARTTLGKTESARQDFEHAITLMDDNFFLRQEYAKLLAQMSVTGEPSVRDDAIEDCMQQCAAALAIRPHATGPRLLRAEFLFRQRKNDEARQEAEQLKDDSIDPEQRSYAWNLLALIALREGNQSDALANFKSAIAADGNNAEAHLNLGKASRDAGLAKPLPERTEFLEQALRHYASAIQIKGTLREQVLPLVAQAQEDLGRFEEAIGTYSNLIDAFGATAKRYKKRAALYDRIGNTDEASKNRARALELE